MAKQVKKHTKKAKVLMTLSNKPVGVNHPIKQFLNKFWVYNIFSIIGLIMLILSLTRYEAFASRGVVIGNIVVSVLVLVAGLTGDITYGALLYHKGERPLEAKLAKICIATAWIPLVGFIVGLIWKHKEKNALYLVKKKENPEFKKPKLQLPNSISIIFAGLVAVVFVIWILYIAGVLKPDSAKGEVVPGILDIFLNPLKGFAGYTKTVNGQSVKVMGVGSIVIFLLLFNGTMSLVNDARAIEAGIGGLLRKMKGKEIILIPILMFILAICGSTFNMCEQLLPLFLVVIPIFYAAGYDRMTGFLVVFMSAGVGVLGSTVNPVLIGTAISAMSDTASAAGVTLMTGIVWRLVIFLIVTLTSIVCTIIYAKKVKANPKRSCVYMQQKDFAKAYNFDKDALPPMTGKRKATLIVFAIAFFFLIFGFIDWEAIIPRFIGFSALSNGLAKYFPFISSMGKIGSWGMVEAAMLFFIAALVIGIINWKGAGHWFSTLYAGCREFIGVAFIVAVGKGLAITLTDSGFNTIIANGLGGVLGKVGNVGIILLVFLVICLLTLLIPSSSGLASAMFPVIGPAIAKANVKLLSGSVTSFAAAMGWVNLFTPTGMVLPFLEVSKMDMSDFTKAAWKQILIVLLVTIALLSIGAILPVRGTVLF